MLMPRYSQMLLPARTLFRPNNGLVSPMIPMQVRFASSFQRLDRTLDAFEPEKYTLQRTDQSLLVSQPWTQRPFVGQMQVPFFSFVTGRFANEVATLDPENFNQPLRRDIVHKVFEYFEH